MGEETPAPAKRRRGRPTKAEAAARRLLVDEAIAGAAVRAVQASTSGKGNRNQKAERIVNQITAPQPVVEKRGRGRPRKAALVDRALTKPAAPVRVRRTTAAKSENQKATDQAAASNRRAKSYAPPAPAPDPVKRPVGSAQKRKASTPVHTAGQASTPVHTAALSPAPYREVVTFTTMARWLRIVPRSFRDIIAAGCPAVSMGGAGKGGTVDVAEVIAWVRERDRKGENLDMTRAAEGALNARRRNAEAQADLRELELARLRRETVLVDEVRPIIADELASVRSRLMAMAGRLAPAVADLDDPQACEIAIADEVREALTELTVDVKEFADLAEE